jgi:hypothetical protein
MIADKSCNFVPCVRSTDKISNCHQHQPIIFHVGSMECYEKTIRVRILWNRTITKQYGIDGLVYQSPLLDGKVNVHESVH